MAAQRLLYEFPSFEEWRRRFWPLKEPIYDKLYGDLNSLRQMTAFFRDTQFDIRKVFDEEKEEEITAVVWFFFFVPLLGSS